MSVLNDFGHGYGPPVSLRGLCESRLSDGPAFVATDAAGEFIAGEDDLGRLLEDLKGFPCDLAIWDRQDNLAGVVLGGDVVLFRDEEADTWVR
jgi:hypothetical protein